MFLKGLFLESERARSEPQLSETLWKWYTEQLGRKTHPKVTHMHISDKHAGVYRHFTRCHACPSLCLKVWPLMPPRNEGSRVEDVDFLIWMHSPTHTHTHKHVCPISIRLELLSDGLCFCHAHITYNTDVQDFVETVLLHYEYKTGFYSDWKGKYSGCYWWMQGEIVWKWNSES